MIHNTAKKTALLLAFLAFIPVGTAAFAQSVTGTDPVPGPYRPSPKSTVSTTNATSATNTSSAATDAAAPIMSVLMAFLLAVQGM